MVQFGFGESVTFYLVIWTGMKFLKNLLSFRNSVDFAKPSGRFWHPGRSSNKKKRSDNLECEAETPLKGLLGDEETAVAGPSSHSLVKHLVNAIPDE